MHFLLCFSAAASTLSQPRATQSRSALVAREFMSWDAYYQWRNPLNTRQSVVACVRSSLYSFDCLPSLIIIGTMKGGTTGVRNKLVASGRWLTKVKHDESSEGHVWGEKALFTAPSSAGPAAIAKEYAAIFGHISVQPKDLANESARLEMHNLIDKDGCPRQLVFEDTPRILHAVGQSTARLMLSVVPDAQILMLARSPGDVKISAMEMSLCVRPPFSNDACSQLETQSCENAQMKIVRDAQRHATEARVVAAEQLTGPSANAMPTVDVSHPLGTYFAHGAFAWPLEHVWLKAFPAEQLLVLSSEYLWSQPVEAYKQLKEAMRLPFEIVLVDGTRTRPRKQDEGRCQCQNTSTFRAFARSCSLARVYSCPFTFANSRLASLLNASWPLSWNEAPKVLDREACLRLGFQDEDWNSELFSSTASIFAKPPAEANDTYKTADSSASRRGAAAGAVVLAVVLLAGAGVVAFVKCRPRIYGHLFNTESDSGGREETATAAAEGGAEAAAEEESGAMEVEKLVAEAADGPEQSSNEGGEEARKTWTRRI